ncbi:hypothetical protein SUDANB121_02819 [Nocardiopsis dassonvillei]|uniref:short chain dehydrogenase n=1 Tax=Nocardiopsis dassonvillei TaxID=2014 RepID=UPI003F562A13
MRILLVGATGKLGSELHRTLAGRGHDVVGVGRSGGDIRCDITDPQQSAALWDRVGTVDAVASAAGDVPYRPFAEMESRDYTRAFEGKVLAQIDLVRTGLPHVAPRGSFTLITGILAREPIVTGSAASMANGALEAFVRAAAVEIAPRRINAVSPSVFTESLDDYGDFFPGFAPVDLADVAAAYVRSIEGADTGRVHELP